MNSAGISVDESNLLPLSSFLLPRKRPSQPSSFSPRRKTHYRRSASARWRNSPCPVHIGLDEGLLSQVVAQLFIAQCLVEKEPTHRRLIFPDKLVKGLLVPEYSHLRHESYVVELHHISFCL